jgi:hypothetical protein
MDGKFGEENSRKKAVNPESFRGKKAHKQKTF